MARRIEVEIIGDSRKLEQAFARSERSARKFDQQMGRSSKRMSASFSSIAIGWQTAVAGGTLVLAKQFVDAHRNAEIVLGQTQVALADAGLSWTKYGKTIEDAATRISNSSAFDDEAVLQSFQTFVRGQKDVTRSMQLTELAADVARGRYIDLEQATQLVNKAAMGQTGALRRAGIQIDKNATSAEALDALLSAYSGSAKTYADSATGSSEKLAVAWENLAETAGGPLSDALANVADQLTIIVGLMQKAKDIDIPDGGFLGKVLKGAATGIFPGFALPGLLGGAGGGRNNTPPAARPQPVPPTSRFFFGGAKKDMTAEPFFDALDRIVAFTTKWVKVGKKFDDASKAWEAKQKAAAARRERMQLQRQRFAAGLANQQGWLEFGVERAGNTQTLADDRRALKKQEDWLKSRIRHAGRTLDLVRDLYRVRQQLRDLNKKNADKDPLAGLMQASTKQLTNMLAAGTGLTGAGKGRLAYNIAGAEIVVHTNVHMDGAQVASVVNRHNARGSRRTAAQTSGRRG